MELHPFVWRFLWRLTRSQDRDTFPPRTGEVTSVAFSPDGKVLVSAGADGIIQLWDVPGKTLLETMPAHQGPAAAGFSPDGRLLASSGWEDGTVKVWNAASRPVALLRQMRGFRRPRARPLFTPDGKTLIAGSQDDTVQLWDIGSGTQTPPADRSIPIRAAGPMSLSPDGGTLAVCGAGKDAGRVTLWSIARGSVPRPAVSLPPIAGLVESLAFSPDGRILAAGAAGGLILWDAAAGRRLRAITGHEGVIIGVAFSPDGRTLASCGLDGTIRLWNPASGQSLAILQGHTARVTSVTFSPRGETLASASADGTTRLWDTNVSRLRDAAREHSEAEILTAGGDNIGAVAFSPDGTLLAGMRLRAVSIWNVSTRARVDQPLPAQPRASVGRMVVRRACAFTPDGRLLAVAGAGGTVGLWDAAHRRMIGTLRGGQTDATHLVFAAGGVLIAGHGGGSLGGPASVRLWDVTSRRLLAALPADSSMPHCPVAVSPDGRTIAAASPEHRVTLWGLAPPAPPARGGEGRPRKAATLEGALQCLSLAFSPDGRVVAGGASGGAVYLWDRASGKQTRRLVGHVGPVLALAFSPDGRTLATGGMDGTVRLWKPGVDQEAATLTGHQGSVWAVAFSADGNLLATGSPDGTVRLWRAAPFPKTEAIVPPPRSLR